MIKVEFSQIKIIDTAICISKYSEADGVQEILRIGCLNNIFEVHHLKVAIDGVTVDGRDGRGSIDGIYCYFCICFNKYII